MKKKSHNNQFSDRQQLLAEQQKCLMLGRSGKSYEEISKELGMSLSQVKRRVSAALKRERLDPALADKLAAQGITDLAGLHSGWLLEKDKTGSGSSLYFYLGPDQEKISFADAIMEVLSEIPRLEPVQKIRATDGVDDLANWVALADLHIGGDYGDPKLEEDFNWAIDDIVARMPLATHAVLFELGDLLEANDHKGETPKSGNRLEVKIGPKEHLKSVKTAVKLLRRAIYRLLETHDTVEVQMVKGNHDLSAFIGVMVALAAHFENNNRVEIVVSADDFRVIMWGECAAFPNHGDELNWNQLKDVFADQFPDEWAQAKTHRHIMTAHFHTNRGQDLVGAYAEHFRTLHRPNGWARAKGMFARGSLNAITMHKTLGERHRTSSNIRASLKGE